MALLNVGGPIPVQLTMRVVGRHDPSLLGTRWANVQASRAAEYAQAKNHAICWLGGRAREVVKELNQQIKKIIAGAKSNVKYPNLSKG